MKAKNPKASHQFHTPNTKFGMGDFYGTGIKAKIGKSIDVFTGSNVPEKKLGTPPKSLA